MNEQPTPISEKRLVTALKNAHLSKKQRELLQTVADLPPYMQEHPSSLYWGNIPEHIWFTFRTENAVRMWMENLVSRGFLRLENDFFYYITVEGRAAIGQNAQVSREPGN